MWDDDDSSQDTVQKMSTNWLDNLQPLGDAPMYTGGAQTGSYDYGSLPGGDTRWLEELGSIGGGMDIGDTFDMYKGLPTESSYADMAYDNSPNYFKNALGDASQALSNIFNNKMTPWAVKGLGALYSGYQNRRSADAYKKLAQSQALDPFGSQRPVYQQELQNAIRDPNSIPLIKQQTDALARAQAIKDAAAGRRSNNATSSPAMLAAQAEAAQKYINSMMTPAGANIAPNGNAIANAMSNSIKADTNGYVSPLLYVLNDYSQSKQNENLLTKLFG